MQKQVIELKRDKSVVQQAIMKSQQKIAQLEDQVGVWTENRCSFYSAKNSK